MPDESKAVEQKGAGSPTAADPANVLDLRERKLEVREEEVSVRERLVELREKDSQRSTWRDPLFLAIVAAVVGLLGNVVVTLVQGHENRDAQTAKSNLDRDADDRKARSDLILRAIKTDDTDASKKNLDFLIQTSILSDPDGKIEKYIQNNTAPVLPVEGGISGPTPPRPSTARATMKYREANLSVTPDSITVDDLFGWPKLPVDDFKAETWEGPIDPREEQVVRITGELYAAQLDGRSGTLRVMIAPPGHADTPDHLVIFAVPDPMVGDFSFIHNPQPYLAARESLLKFLGTQIQALSDPGFKFDVRHSRVTATGYLFYNPYYLKYGGMRGHTGKIGAWQLSPVWSIAGQ